MAQPQTDPASPGFLDDYLPYLLARAAGHISERLHDHLDRTGLAVPVWRTLAALSDQDGKDTVNGLSETCMTLQPTMSKLLQRMEADGLLRREPARRDRRVVLVSLTPGGRKLAEGLCAAARQFEQEALADLPPEQLAVVKAVAQELARRAGPPRPGQGKLSW